MSITEISELVFKAGLPSAMVVWLLMKNHAREDVNSKRLANVEEFQKTTLLNLVRDSMSLQTSSNELQARSNELLSESVKVLSESTRTIELALKVLEKAQG